jgi:phosphate-selective porin OprO/OprP
MAVVPPGRAEETVEDSDVEPASAEQQEGMAENLADSVPGVLDNIGSLGNLRVILPENLRDMHRMKVKDRDQDEAATAEAAAEAEEKEKERKLGADEADSPVLVATSDAIMDFSRVPLTFIQERVPFFTKRGMIFFGRFELDGVNYTSGILEEDSGFELRRFRLGLAGHVIPWPNWNYKLEFDLTDGANSFSDVYLSWHSHRWGTIRLGNQKIAPTLSGQTSSISVPFMERPLPITAFSLERRLGIGYDLHRKRGGTHMAVFTHDINDQVGSQGYALRGYFNPTRGGGHIVHLGASVMKFDSDDDAQIRTRPESHLTDTRLVNTGIVDDVGNSTAFGIEIAGSVGPATLRSEFYRVDWQRDNHPDPRFDGWYLEASWFLTGERSNYRQGKFIRPDVRKPGGAWEIAARYSTVDLNDEDIEGGTEDNVSFGVNWYSQVHWRFLGNVIKVDADGPEGEEDPWILQFRVQYFF